MPSSPVSPPPAADDPVQLCLIDGELDDEDLVPSMTAMPALQRQASWIVLGGLEIGQRQKGLIDEVMACLNTSQDEAALLLRAYDWKKSDVILAWITNQVSKQLVLYFFFFNEVV